MKDSNISDDLLSRFLEGKMTEAEEAEMLRQLDMSNAFPEELAAIAEAAKRTDTQPLVKPDFEKAKAQISEELRKKEQSIPTIAAANTRPSHKRIYWAVAASLALLVAAVLFFLLRPEADNQHFAQNATDSTATERTQPADNSSLAQSKPSQTNSADEQINVHDPQSSSAETPQYYNTQVKERHYATEQSANTLTVTKPNKSPYRVLCKNLDKTLDFEWAASNVKSLQLTVRDGQGKVLDDFTDKTTNHFTLKYQDLYPERIVNWNLTVTFTDGTQATRNGQIQIDYRIQ